MHPRETLKIGAEGEGEVANLRVTPEGGIVRNGSLVARSVQFRERDGTKVEGLEIVEPKIDEEWVVSVWVGWRWVLERRDDGKGVSGRAGRSRRWWGKLIPKPLLGASG